MTVQQYLRKAVVAVGSAGGAGQDFSAFRCVFNVRRGDFQNPNSCDLRIYNLSDDTAHSLANPNSAEFTQVAISAGYDGNFGLIFNGTIKQVRIGRENQKDTYVDITAADGDAAYNYATISQSLAATGANATGIAAALLTALQSKQITANPANVEFGTDNPVRGKVLYGLARDELRDFAAANNCSWSSQDGQLTFIPLTADLPGDTPVISATTGLIGIPEQTQQGIQMRVLLNPFLKIGQAVKLDNASAINQLRLGLDVGSQASNPQLASSIKTNADGLYYVMVANHSGDTRGANWYTDLTCLAIDASVPLSYGQNTNPFVVGPVPVQRY